MGNAMGGRRTAKVMKINGETMIFKTPVRAEEVVKGYPGFVLLESESVKHYGTRAKPLESHQELKHKRLYFLVEMPKVNEVGVTRRVRSGIIMSAKDRLESLMLARRSTSDLSIIKPTVEEERPLESGLVRVKMRLSKAEVEKIMMDSEDKEAAVEKIFRLCLATKAASGGGGAPPEGRVDLAVQPRKQVEWADGHGRAKDSLKKRVSFQEMNRPAEIMEVAVAS